MGKFFLFSIHKFVRSRISGKRDKKLCAKILTPVLVETDKVTIFFYIAHNGVFHIVVTVGNALPGGGEDLAFVAGQVVKIALFQMVVFNGFLKKPFYTPPSRRNCC